MQHEDPASTNVSAAWLGAAEGVSVCAVAARELRLGSHRVDTLDLLAALADHQIDASSIAEDLDTERG